MYTSDNKMAFIVRGAGLFTIFQFNDCEITSTLTDSNSLDQVTHIMINVST